MDSKTVFDARRATLGEILVQVGVITPDQLEIALKECDPSQQNIGQVVVALGFTTEEKILKAVSIRMGIPYFTTFDGMIEPDAVGAIPESLARKHLAVPLLKTEDSLTVGMVNPVDIVAIDELALQCGLKVLPVMTPLQNLLENIQKVYVEHSAQSPVDPKAALKAAKDQFIRFQAGESAVVDTVNAIISEGIDRKASDIHLEAGETLGRLRYRIDGLLQDGKTFDKEMHTALVARIKILARISIVETRLPQDGHIRFSHKKGDVDIRVSTVPGVDGEKVVLRLLDSTKSLRKLTDLALSEENLKSFMSAIKRPNNIILVTGPTSSGKTTTLYAALSQLNDPTCNIVTLEDPVEYRMDRITQIETHAKIGLTFAAGLRSILRQDPNVILVGEIRDVETAEIAVQAAITGHRVFSTLHTNDAVTAVHRLITMRIEPFLIAAALGGVMAQRLVRRLCDSCKKKHALNKVEKEVVERNGLSERPFFEFVGCKSCFNTGYAGRLAIHEWLDVGRNIKELILNRSSVDDLRAAAESQGMTSLQKDGLAKAAQGLTSLAEVMRVTHDEAGI